jgi:hypothetical protein
MLRNYRQSKLYCQKCCKKWKHDPELKAVFLNYETIIRLKYLKKGLIPMLEKSMKDLIPMLEKSMKDLTSMGQKFFMQDLKPNIQKDKEVDISPPPSFNNSWPTHRQLAELSGVAYCIELLSPPWRTISEYDDIHNTGYYGVAFKNALTNAIVIAHRGTYLADSISPLFADYNLFRLVKPKQFDVAQHFTNTIRRNMSSNEILWHTGHSLGGAISEFLVANETLFKNSNPPSFAVTFDSPGIMELLEEYNYRKKLIHHLPGSTDFPVIGYLSAPNIVNTMGTHIGLTLRLSPFPPVPKISHPLTQTIYSLMNYITPLGTFKPLFDYFFTLANDQAYWHSLQTIIECFKLFPDENGLPLFIKSVIKWPKGQQLLFRFLDLASQKNLTMLDFRPYHWDDENLSWEDLKYTFEAQYEFKRLDYHVVYSSSDSSRELPFELWSLKAQRFLQQFVKDRRQENAIIQLKPECELMELLGARNFGPRIFRPNRFGPVRNSGDFSVRTESPIGISVQILNNFN